MRHTGRLLPRLRHTVIAATAATIAIGGGLFAQSAGAHAVTVPNTYTQRNLVSDQMHKAQLRDPNLVNAWGLASSSTSPIWVSDNGTNLATVYSGAVSGSPVVKVPITVDIPGGAPTGQVFNTTSDFPLTGTMNPAVFLFDTESGHISGWNMNANATSAINKVNDPNAVYKGLTLASTPMGSRLYAADFSEGTVDVFDGMFHPVHTPGAFTDSMLPSGFAPFNVQTINDRIYVSYAMQKPGSGDELDGHGLGRVDAYSFDGTLLQRFVAGDALNAPWGMVMAPSDFGRFAGDLLVGNFGNGLIHAFDPTTGALVGSLRDTHGQRIQIGGLWALRVGNSTFGGSSSVVFSAGPDDEGHGLLGTLTPAV